MSGSDALLDTFNEAWRWTGQCFVAINAISPFGHMILRDAVGRYSYFDPEQMTLGEIAQSDEGLFKHMSTAEARELWESDLFVEWASAKLGPLREGDAYYWMIAPLFGGAYEADNIATVSLHELVRYAGNVAEQVKDLPDGATIKLQVVE